ncbi:5-methyltetrahydropteroyltriglutamate--homocysteine S-methyltransferase [Cytobacillus oceanisediminis]|uniref:5-methyltetrahydropteroyltriglutamate-- homocysteine S-methyltransferase n=1 Tax=Bacillaceae TaxID=186817 RepID=UPI001CCE9479|nr:5-methyltetrahydropteroyltriglutamate--homocysteine S-methyltransferase [Cytobacillus oceanisediminis]MBQ6448227.1 5-methyltetrahydropteroyltriglutamate--homocysteine S-methyltransferase [Bacillus sp. (in: firmicutes)]MBZ9535923.1 5-methyltetrahydropteroyltriglutamate--homocysteine S-methyltransferase [Cytobacillus oceanisediminis]
MYKSSNLGYPRIGEKREWKRALERYWKGDCSEEELLQETKNLRLKNLQKQKLQGIDLIPVGDFSFYDHVLDTATMFGQVPSRFAYNGGKVPLQTYFQIARGNTTAVAAAMKKWFNTNYHYIVPELGERKPTLTENRPLFFYREAKEALGIEGKPVLLGPLTFIKLAKGYEEDKLEETVASYLPLYAQILKELEAEGVKWIQIDEPYLVTDVTPREWQITQQIYHTLQEAAPKLKVILQTYFDAVTDYETIISLPVAGIGLDFVHDDGQHLASIQQYGFPEDKILAAGIIDGRNVWRTNLEEKWGLLAEIQKAVGSETIIIQPSSSLLHVPVTVKEEQIDPIVKVALSFADEKLQEISTLTEGVRKGKAAIQAQIDQSVEAISKLNASSARNNQILHEELNRASDKPERSENVTIRQQAQQGAFSLPILPTTTIGSFPQTKEVRKERLRWRKGEITNEEYETFIQAEIKKWIEIQEDLGLDVFVHGEFERTDMVEYFGEKLAGFQFTTYGWVQSYGSRCVKPPIIYGDVAYVKPMTVKETVYAQSLTTKPVKGMLTGPITILNWSFVRDDISRAEVAKQIAFSLKKEVEELERNDIRMIQVDEPAIREGLPLKKERWKPYLDTAVYSFKLATTSVEKETQIHTHMCYSNFEDIIDAIDALDVDVISIETSRSHGEFIQTFAKKTYDKGIGLGVYDIHSPRVPTKEEITQNIEHALGVLDPHLFWINPDCGLKTRNEEETIGALEVMVEAAKETREKLVVKNL